jgi:mono/diheme cytochrome c family protein
MHPSIVRLAPVLLAGVLTAGLAACGGGEPASTAATTSSAPPTPGARAYMTNCIACHQRNGEGVKGVYPAVAGAPSVTGEPGVLLAWVMYGVRPETLPKGQYRGVMPQYAYLKDEELAAMLTHVRGSFGNSASPITPEMVAQARAAHAAARQ